MQAFQRAAAVFCMACIGAELVSFFAGQSWAGRCIKAAAGLYILAVLLAQLPRLPGKVLTAFSGSTAPAVLSAMQSDTLETDILTETETRLAEYCTAQCRQQFGLDASVTVTLEKAGQQVVVKKVVAAFPAGCTAAQKQAALSFFAADTGHRSHGSGGEHTVKKNELLSALRSLQNNKNRTALAVTVGVMAMLLLLLSELLPSGNTQKTAASTVRTAAVSQYQTQLEQQLEELISQLQGAGRTTVMVTLTTGEETIYAVDTQTGDLQQQEKHVLLQDGSALAETTYLPQVCGVAVLCEGGGDVRVAARITELLHSLLDLPANRICVEQRKC